MFSHLSRTFKLPNDVNLLSSSRDIKLSRGFLLHNKLENYGNKMEHSAGKLLKPQNKHQTVTQSAQIKELLPSLTQGEGTEVSSFPLPMPVPKAISLSPKGD